MSYSWNDKKALGNRGEAFLNKFFAPVWNIRKGSPVDDRRGIDAWWHKKPVSPSQPPTWPYAVQYKTDAKAHEWGNVLLETERRNVRGEIEPSGIMTCQADILLYYIPALKRIGFMSMLSFKQRELAPLENFPLCRWVESHNKHYRWWARGRRVPIRTFFEDFCFDEMSTKDAPHISPMIYAHTRRRT